MLSKKLDNGRKLKVLTLDNIQVSTIDAKFGIENLRSFHAINCGISKFASYEVFDTAGAKLKKINLSHNKLKDIPERMSESCSGLEHVIFSNN